MLTCREVTRAVASEELDRAGLRRRLGIRFHLLMCRNCRRYAAQIRALGTAARQLFRERTVDDATIRRLRDAILSRRSSEADRSD